jgi:hypothetical protein
MRDKLINRPFFRFKEDENYVSIRQEAGRVHCNWG